MVEMSSLGIWWSPDPEEVGALGAHRMNIGETIHTATMLRMM